MIYDIEIGGRKTIKHAIFMLYTLIKHGFLTNQSEQGAIYIMNGNRALS